jgi:hypothetical protein
MPPTPTWRHIFAASIFLGTLALTLYNRVAFPDFEALVRKVKAAGRVLYPNIQHQTVITRRTNPAHRVKYREDGLWTARLCRSWDGLVLMEVEGWGSGEQVLEALGRKIEARMEEWRVQEGLRREYVGGVEFERGGRVVCEKEDVRGEESKRRA